MRVVTLDQQGFQEAVDRLSGLVAGAGEVHGMVGILKGGGHVGRRMAETLAPRGGYFEVALRRPSSARKESRAFRLVRRLPRFMLDWLRMAEARWLEWFPGREDRHVDLPADLCEALSQGGRWLIVDDAVDSGLTLKALADAIRQAAPEAILLTAAITQTTPRPAVRPDFALYRNRTLIRFPWSKDNNLY